MVAVVVVDDDAGRLALALQPPPDARERRRARRRCPVPATPSASPAPATARAFAALCRPAVAADRRPRRRADPGRGSRGSCPRLGRDDPPQERGRAVPPPSRTGRRCALSSHRPPGDPSTSASRDDPEIASSEAGRPRPPRPDRRRWRRPSAPSGARRSQARERGLDGRLDRRRRRGDPTRRRSGSRPPGRYGSKLPAYSSASTTNARPWPRRAVAGGPPVIGDGSSAPTNADGSAPAADEDVDEPAGVVLLPCVPATATSSGPTAASATTCCHGSSAMPIERAARELRMVRDRPPSAPSSRPAAWVAARR